MHTIDSVGFESAHGQSRRIIFRVNHRRWPYRRFRRLPHPLSSNQAPKRRWGTLLVQRFQYHELSNRQWCQKCPHSACQNSVFRPTCLKQKIRFYADVGTKIACQVHTAGLVKLSAICINNILSISEYILCLMISTAST